MCPKSHWNTTNLLPRKQSATPETLQLVPDRTSSDEEVTPLELCRVSEIQLCFHDLLMSFQHFPSSAYSYNQEGASNFCWLVQISKTAGKETVSAQYLGRLNVATDAVCCCCSSSFPWICHDECIRFQDPLKQPVASAEAIKKMHQGRLFSSSLCS